MMLSTYFYSGTTSLDVLKGHYDYRLVILSYVVAIFSFYIALGIAIQLRDGINTKFSEKLCLGAGAFAMATGIWSMHFIGMLAFSIPGMDVSYNLLWTALSMIVAVLASGFVFMLLKNEDTSKLSLIFSGLIFGISIATMHYAGMEAMTKSMNIHYTPGLFIISILVAITASETLIWLILKSSKSIGKTRLSLKIFSALIIGAAFCGMHYIGMFAAVFTPRQQQIMQSGFLNPDLLAISIASITFIILAVAFFISIYHEGVRHNATVNTREAGKSEVTANMLYNIGNVLNDIDISTRVIEKKLSDSSPENLNNISHLLEENKNNLGHFITTDPNGKQVPHYIKKLADDWINYKIEIKSELEALIKNINHIKYIVNAQQTIQKADTQNTFTSINDLLDEAISVTRLNDTKHNIEIEKNYANLQPVFIDKQQLLQVIINLLINAKDSLLASKKALKSIYIQTCILHQDTISIKIFDNGVGIPDENLVAIFSHGFTTKETGHGFGLHTCANDISTLGGTISAKSEGIDKGALFIIELPYQTQMKKVKVVELED